ncbi:hypothetical protein GCM10007053_30950 [Halioglobus pacificus]|uniref:Uncharacterized protein n=2 Tax=Parahalioglobus pacificus TaxID=930806 RepID=A0A919CM88_9GAMM|nr:hypothetical protein GCM10007053_30950 [Halioglobus pacificus]
MWAVLPAGVLAVVFGDSGPLQVLLGTAALAFVLRVTVSLATTLLAAVAVGFISGVLALLLAEPLLQQLVSLFGEFLTNMEQQLSQGDETVTLTRPTVTQVAGMMGVGTAMLSVLCVLLARYWQAALYNPEGFGKEFRALRYPAGVATALVLAALGLASLGQEMRTWAVICALPLSFAGLALMHARAAAQGQGSGYLAVFYTAWVLFDPVKLFVMGFAIADSWIDFRSRWVKASDPGRPERDDD